MNLAVHRLKDQPFNLDFVREIIEQAAGEAAQTEIGLTGGGNDNNLLYLSGIPHQKVVNEEIINQVVQLVEEKAKEKNS